MNRAMPSPRRGLRSAPGGYGVPWQGEVASKGSQAREDGAVVRQMEVIGVRVEMHSTAHRLAQEAQGDRYCHLDRGGRGNSDRFAQQGMVSLRPLTTIFRDVLEV